MKGTVVAKCAQIKLERFGFDQILIRHIVNHQMRKVGLAGHRAKRGELGRGEAHAVIDIGLRVRNFLEHRFFGRGGKLCLAAKLLQIAVNGFHKSSGGGSDPAFVAP